MAAQSTLVVPLEKVDPTDLGRVGGKAAHLGSLSRLEGLRVPPGFCITTDAFARVVAGVPSFDEQLERLQRVTPEDLGAIRALSAELRRAIQDAPMPDALAVDIRRALARLGEGGAYAVRSSATAEDLPTASFAGQQDTYLNVVGPAEILEHVRRCWASLFTERAVTYRLRNGIDSRQVRMAVVVQRMVFPEVAGILFTADPVTGNRRVTSMEASFGLGEALVSGRVNADVYTVRGEQVLTRSIATKRLAIEASSTGGTRERTLEPERQQQPALTDAQVVRLAQLGRRLEAHFGCPQDVEWCLVGEDFHVVQSRPITTLFPIPASGDGENRVYISVGHQQMMTDAMTPLGLSLWQLTTRAPMVDAGGRLFVDVTRALASPGSRAGLLETVGKGDPLIRDALESILERGDFVRELPENDPGRAPASGLQPGPAPDPAIVPVLIERMQTSLAALKRDIETRSGPGLFDFILADLQELKRLLFDPQLFQAIMAAMEAVWWLDEKLESWLGDKRAADTLSLSAPDNVTSQMGLELLDVADAIRPFPRVVSFLERVEGDRFLDELPALPGGRPARDAVLAWLDKYGMRCVGEIDISRPRFSERPSTLVPLILSNVRNFGPGESKRRFERGLQEARQKEQEVLERLRALPDGERKAHEAKRMIDQLRAFIGYREYPKYGWVCRYFLYKKALLREAERLLQARVLQEADDVFYLRFQELHDVVRTGRVDERLIRERKDAFKAYQGLEPPRVLTSEGEMLNGSYRRRDVPVGALIGLPVSAGTVEGRARVVTDPANAALEPGDILVTACTDPSWTPVFVSIKGLVTEVGGLMTHGAVITREYGLPAVVGVDLATRLIRDGQRIRVNGTEGYVELLSDPAPAT